MKFRIIYFIQFLSLLSLYLIETTSYLTKHETHELYGEIKQLHITNEVCNNKYNKLIQYLLKHNISFNISEFLTPGPDLYH